MKKMMAVIAIACLSLLILPSVALADQDNLRVIPAGGGEGALYGTFAEALEAAENGDTIQLNADITLGDGVEAETATVALAIGTADAPVTLDLNGHTLTGTGVDSVISIASDAYIILADSSTAGTGTITQPQPEGDSHWGPIEGGGIHNKGAFTMNGGTIYKCVADDEECEESGDEYALGGGVYNSGTFTMTGGAISECYAYGYNYAHGGGVYNAGTFTMTGGTIDGCVADSSHLAAGGGVYLANGSTTSFTMSGGSISECATDALTYDPGDANLGGGVYVDKAATFNLQGGAISDCIAYKGEENSIDAYGGGVFVNDMGSFTMTSGTISGCAAKGTGHSYGGGVYNSYRFTMSGGAISGCSAEGAYTYGGGVFNDKWLTMSGGTIGGTGEGDECVAQKGGGVYNYGLFSSFAMSGESAIVGCRAGSSSVDTGHGGGVYTDADRFTMEGKATISACKAIVKGEDNSDDALGGGVYVRNDFGSSHTSLFEMQADENGFAPQIIGCSAVSPRNGQYARPGMGAGVYVDEGCAFYMEDGSIANCSITESDRAYGGGVYNDGKFQMEGGSISGCSVAASDEYAEGGGVYNGNDFYLFGGSISGCSVTSTLENSNGGGVYNYGDLFVKGAPTITDNTLNGNRNNVYLYEEDYWGTHYLLTMSDDFTGEIGVSQNANKAALGVQFGTTFNGVTGAINFSCDSADYCGAVDEDNNLVWANPPVAIIVRGETTTKYQSVREAAADAQDGDTITMIDDSVETAVVAVSAGSSAKPVTLDLAGHTLTGIGKSKSPGNQPAPVIRIGMSSALTIEDSSADKTGTITQPEGSDTLAFGAYVDAGATLTMNGGTITGCNALKGSESEACGGGVNVFRGTFNMNGGVIEKCSAVNGGGVYNYQGTFNMTDGKISQCHAELPAGSTLEYSNGGGVYNDDATGRFNWSGGEISYCTAQNNGGGVYSRGTFTMSGGVLCYCNAMNDADMSSRGGGVYVEGTSETPSAFTMSGSSSIKGCTVERPSNYSGAYGGGVYIKYGTFTMSDSSGIQDCMATGRNGCYGGGVYVEGTSEIPSAFTMTGSSSIQECTAIGEHNDNSAGAGGGVYAGGISTFTMSNTSSIQKCAAKGDTGAQGGGVYVYSDAGFTMAGGTISECSVTYAGTRTNISANGGGVCSYGSLTMSGGSITECTAAGSTAAKGGGLYSSGNLEISGDVTIADNTTTGYGEGLEAGDRNNAYLDETSLVTLTGDFAGNIGITQKNGSVEGGQFGVRPAGEAFTGAERFTCDTDAGLIGSFGDVDDQGRTKLVWTKAAAKPTAVKGLVYNGAEQTGVVGGEGYTLAGTSAATNAGSYTATATLVDGYLWADGSTDDVTVTWSIGRAALRSVTLLPTSYTYDGTAKKPTATVKNAAGVKLKSATDYSLAYYNASGKKVASAKATGTYTVKATGAGNYKGTVSAKFTIGRASIAKAAIAAIPAQKYTGKAIKPAVSVTLGGKALKGGTDYKTAYKNNTKVGTATVTVTGTGNYTGSAKATFRIEKPSWVEVGSATNAVATFAATSRAGFPGGSKAAVLVRSDGFADSLGASALAGALNAPIIATEPDSLSAAAKTELTRLKCKTVYIVGGTSAVSAKAEKTVKLLGCSVTRIAGDTRTDTAIAVAAKVAKLTGSKDTVFIAKGWDYPDTLSIGSYTYASASPILLAQTDGSLDAATAKAAKAYKNVVVLGGDAGQGVKDAAVKKLGKTWCRLAGATRYETSAEIGAWAAGKAKSAAVQPAVKLGYGNVSVARGDDFVGGLAAVNVAGPGKSVLVLVDPASAPATQAGIAKVVKPNIKQMTQGYIVGGSAAVGKDVASYLKKLS